MPRHAWFLAYSSAILIGLAARAADEPAPSPEQLQFFESQVRPVLLEHCTGCHGSKKIKAGLRLAPFGDTMPVVHTYPKCKHHPDPGKESYIIHRPDQEPAPPQSSTKM